MSNEHIILQGSNVSHAAESAGHHDDLPAPDIAAAGAVEPWS